VGEGVESSVLRQGRLTSALRVSGEDVSAYLWLALRRSHATSADALIYNKSHQSVRLAINPQLSILQY
jgi:hypothetical protein